MRLAPGSHDSFIGDECKGKGSGSLQQVTYLRTDSTRVAAGSRYGGQRIY